MRLNLAETARSTTQAPDLIAETARLVLRRIEISDAPFLLRQLTQPSWLQYIGDKGVKTLDDADKYIRTGPMEMYKKHGFGINVVRLKSDGTPVGVCGLVKRDSLPLPDLGFALLEDHWGHGYALEAAAAVVAHAKATLGHSRLLAITTPANDRSGRLLVKLGFRLEGPVRLAPGGEELKLYVLGAANVK